MSNKMSINESLTKDAFVGKMNSWLFRNALIGTHFTPYENVENIGVSKTMMYGDWHLMKVGTTQWINSFIRSPHLTAFHLQLAKEKGSYKIKMNPVFMVLMSHLIQIGSIPYDDFLALTPSESIEYLDELNNFHSIPVLDKSVLIRDPNTYVFSACAFDTEILYGYLTDGAESLALSKRTNALSFANWNAWLTDNFFEVEIILKKFVRANEGNLQKIYNSFSFR